jgi:hypothetical protein
MSGYDPKRDGRAGVKKTQAIPGWEVPKDAGMYGARTTATNPPAPAPAAAPAAAIPMGGKQTERTAGDARWSKAVDGFGDNNEPVFSKAGLSRAGYDRPEIRDANVVPSETVGGMLGSMMNPKGEQALSGALQAAAARGDWDAVGRYYASKGQTFGGKMYGGDDDQMSKLWTTFNDDSAFGRDRKMAGLMLQQMMQNQTMLDRQALANEPDMARTKAYSEAEGRKGALDWSKYEDERNQRPIATKFAQQKLRSDFFQSDAGSQYLRGLEPTARAAILKEVYGMAEGGEVIAPPDQNPMGTFGQPPAMQSLDPFVREYGQYVHAASMNGLQPVPFGKFINLLSSARQQMQTMPTTGGQYGFADGGVVGWMKSLWPTVGPLDTPAPAAPAPQTPQQQMGQGAALLGNGMAGQAVQALQGRRAALEDALGAAQGARGYASGGAIPVGGRQVLGPGGPKSDSIPAVVDGTQPAALSSGEFVFPVEAVQFHGTSKLNKMIEQARGGM